MDRSTSSGQAVVLTERPHEHVALVRLNRPKVLNALSNEVAAQLAEAFETLDADGVTRAVVLTGDDRAFAAGADIAEFAAEGPRLEVWDRLWAIGLPVVAAVRGVALGGGLELAMSCDMLVVADDARLGQPEINLGVFPPVAAYQLSRIAPPRRGLELLLTGDTIDAQTAATLGLVNAVFPVADFAARADEWLQRLWRQSASSLRLTKKAFRLAQSADFDERLANVERLYLEELMKTDDATEGLNAFLEKRKPAWKGR